MKDYFEVTQDDVDNAYKAGQQSQQAKIDELQDEIQGYKRIYGELEWKRDELQARVDEALRCVVDHGGYDDLTHVIKILKGKENE